ncbi:4Fe-4S dicluster domain-containing protein [Rhodohalobacter sp.]|uniref:4Fe-4S dicluster domain-containing protein n=1 Tax=Rhodohalobacter sp. TaxID=1974210 RepID=UPI002ACE50A4|nr:4Fe-4S dicluster domain-containing protein [Rhodohalobacter sp.]MDZ7756812.1 4Fe-4S dicluster domain-containing protein [Rhodohalobacter sp.]
MYDKKELTRKDFIKAGASVVTGVAISAGAVTAAKLSPAPEDPTGPETIRNYDDFETVPVNDESDLLIRMQNDLKRALSKPMEERKWKMSIDTTKCVGCHACTVACNAENKLPPGVVYRPVLEEEIGEYPNTQLRYFPRPCMQCDKPSCVSVCPVNATWKRPDGIVSIDYDKCIGCRYCLSACPYGARTSDFGHYYTEGTPELQPYEQRPNNEYGKSWLREDHESPIGNARKCHFCLHRLDEGQLPQCVTTCIGRATIFGDANDPDSLVSEMEQKSNQIKLLEEKGTKPQVTYFI